MERCNRFGISLPNKLLKRFDKDCKSRGYQNRSEAIRDLIRNRLTEAEWENEKQSTTGAVVLVYDHHKQGLSEKLTKKQHGFHDSIISSMHAHLDHDNCMEVILLRGRGTVIRHLADQLISTKNVKVGKFVRATVGRKLD